MEHNIKGAGVALVTPFDGEGRVDLEALGRLVDSVTAGGADFLVALGTTAETPTLSQDERAAVARYIKEKNAGRLPLVIGKGGNDTAKLCEELRNHATTDGYDAVLSVTPYYNKPSQEGLFRHYRAVAEASPLPVILYNVPSRTGVNMSAETSIRIAREVPNVIGIKEACGDIRQIEAIVKGVHEGFLVISGDDGMTLDTIAAGGVGVISVLANVLPEPFCRMVHSARDDMAGAREIWAGLDEITRLLFAEGSPTGVKTALALKGVCRADVRLPLVEGSDGLRVALRELLG